MLEEVSMWVFLQQIIFLASIDGNFFPSINRQVLIRTGLTYVQIPLRKE